MRLKTALFISLVSVFLFSAGMASAMPACELDLDISRNTNVKILGFKKTNDSYEDYHIEDPDGNHIVTILTKSGERVYFSKFSLSMFHAWCDPPCPGPSDAATLYWKVPCPENATDIVIYYKEREIYRLKDIQTLLCNNDLECGEYENSISCPSDCGPSSRDRRCNKAEDDICDPDCYRTQDPDCIITGGGKIVQALRDNYCNTTRDGACDMDCTKAEDPDCMTAEGVKIYNYDEKCDPAKDGACDMDCGRKDPDCLQVKEIYPPETKGFGFGGLLITAFLLVGGLFALFLLYRRFIRKKRGHKAQFG